MVPILLPLLIRKYVHILISDSNFTVYTTHRHLG